MDKDAELVVDTDVLILLIEMCHRLPAATSFLTGRRNLRRNVAVQAICEKLGEKRTSAMIGFHAFTGSDNVREICWQEQRLAFQGILEM